MCRDFNDSGDESRAYSCINALDDALQEGPLRVAVQPLWEVFPLHAHQLQD